LGQVLVHKNGASIRIFHLKSGSLSIPNYIGVFVRQKSEGTAVMVKRVE